MACTTTITPNKIIEEAFKIIGIFSEERTLSGHRLKEGFDLLNTMLDQFSAEPFLIAFNSELTFNLVQGQRDYTFAPTGTPDVTSNVIVGIQYMTILDELQHPVQIVGQNLWYNRPQNLTNSRRPRKVFLQNSVGQSLLRFLSLPDQNYSCTIKGKFALSDLVLNTAITEVPSYYILFLESALARKLHARYPGSTWNDLDEKDYIEMMGNLKVKSDKDLTAITSSALNKNRYSSNFLGDI